LNKIDAALDKVSRIADATDWSAAMEAIAISQFRAGAGRVDLIQQPGHERPVFSRHNHTNFSALSMRVESDRGSAMPTVS